jgi:hypothetical protein
MNLTVDCCAPPFIGVVGRTAYNVGSSRETANLGANVLLLGKLMLGFFFSVVVGAIKFLHFNLALFFN